MSNSDNQKDTLTITQVAEHFDVHATTVQRWVKQGYFPGARRRGPAKNSPILIPRTDVEDFEEQLKIVVTDE